MSGFCNPDTDYLEQTVQPVGHVLTHRRFRGDIFKEVLRGLKGRIWLFLFMRDFWEGGQSKDLTNPSHESLISFILESLETRALICRFCCTPTRHDVHLVEELQLLDEVPVIQNA